MALQTGDKGTGMPAARLEDKVSCPMHGTTTIVSGSPDTIFDYRPAAVQGDETACGAALAGFSSSVLINGKPAAVVGCATTHGGTVTTGSTTVIIGAPPIPATVQQAVPATSELSDQQKKFSLAFDFSEMHEAGNHNGINYANMPIKITTPDGVYITTVRTDGSGISTRFFTEEEQEVVAWVGPSDHWEVFEEYEEDDENESPSDA